MSFTIIPDEMSTTETKNFKIINFHRRVSKIICENAEMSYGEFSKHIRKNGLNGKKITDDELIKKMWDELANYGDDDGEGWSFVDTQQEREYENCEDECWDDDDDLWEFINNFDYECTITPEPEKTPEQKAEEEKAKEKERLEWVAKVEEDRLKRIAWREEKEAKQKEYEKKQKEERIANAPKNLLNAISSAVEIYQHPPSPPDEEDEQWKIKVMRSVARQRILGKMKELVVQLKMVAKW
jgi:hypothetical protein